MAHLAAHLLQGALASLAARALDPSRPRPGRCRRSSSCTATAITRRCGSPRCGASSRTAIRPIACTRSTSPIRWRAPTMRSRNPAAPRPRISCASSMPRSTPCWRAPAQRASRWSASSRGGYAIRNLIQSGGARARQPRGAVRRAEPRRVRLGGQPGQRVQRPRAVPQAAQRRRERRRAGHRVPDPAQRRQRQVRASRRPLRRPRRHADRHHQRRPGAARRDQSGARPARPSRGRVPPARVPRDLQVHHRPRAGAARYRVRAAGDARRAGDRIPRRHADQSPARRGDGRDLSRDRPTRRAHRRTDPPPRHRRRRPMGTADGRFGLGRSNSSSRRPGHPVTHIYRSPFPRSSASCICGPAARSPQPTRAPAPWCRCRGRAAISAFRATWCCSTARSRRTSPRASPAIRPPRCGCPPSEIGRPIVALFNEERIVCRGWPASENRITIAELDLLTRNHHAPWNVGSAPRSTTSRAGSNSRCRPRSSPAA